MDFINDLDFPGANALAKPALAAARNAAAIAQRARTAKVPVVYVNDNFRRWSHDFGDIVRHCQAKGGAAAELANQVAPQRGDFVILKPKNSGFYETPLATLLEQLGVRHLYLTGLTADNCILFTANDAHLRDYTLTVVHDAVASCTRAMAARALEHMVANTKARLAAAASIRFDGARKR